MKKKKDRTIFFCPKAGLETKFEDRYLNIPINLLRGIFENSHGVAQRIIIFCIYQFAFDRLSHETLTDRINIAGKFFEINTSQNAYIMHHGRELYLDWMKNGYPRGGIKVKVLHDLMDCPKSEFDLIIFCALVGLKSIIQNDPYKKTSFDTLFARMAGFSSAKLAEGKIPESILKYNSRHYRKKFVNALEDYWHLAYEADHTRGFYFSFKLNHEELFTAIQKNKIKRNQSRIEKVQQKKETRKKVKQLFDK
jgi:hypothetical protein